MPHDAAPNWKILQGCCRLGSPCRLRRCWREFPCSSPSLNQRGSNFCTQFRLGAVCRTYKRACACTRSRAGAPSSHPTRAAAMMHADTPLVTATGRKLKPSTEVRELVRGRSVRESLKVAPNSSLCSQHRPQHTHFSSSVGSCFLDVGRWNPSPNGSFIVSQPALVFTWCHP